MQINKLTYIFAWGRRFAAQTTHNMSVTAPVVRNAAFLIAQKTRANYVKRHRKIDKNANQFLTTSHLTPNLDSLYACYYLVSWHACMRHVFACGQRTHQDY